MGCNSTLTDDPLEAMFMATDKEIRQIQQPMECLIERTQYKCKRCTRFFSNDAALKQHHCKSPIKKEKCSICGKTINRTNNLEKHLSCEKAPPTNPAKRQLHQTTLDGPASSENGLSKPKKLIVEKIQVGGAPAEHWKAPEIVGSALKYTALTFRKTFNSNNKREVLQQLKVINSMRPMIEGQARAKVVSITKHELLQLHTPWHQETSGC